MGLFKNLFSDIIETDRVKRDEEDKLWNLIENMDLSNKQIEYGIWNVFYGAKKYRIISPSGDYILINAPEPRVCINYYEICYYKKTSDYYPSHEFVSSIHIGCGLYNYEKEAIVKRLLLDLERRKHMGNIDAMDRF